MTGSVKREHCTVCVRERMLEDVALASAAADLSHATEAERPRCPGYGAVLTARGSAGRQLTAHFDQTLH